MERVVTSSENAAPFVREWVIVDEHGNQGQVVYCCHGVWIPNYNERQMESLEGLDCTAPCEGSSSIDAQISVVLVGPGALTTQ